MCKDIFLEDLLEEVFLRLLFILKKAFWKGILLLFSYQQQKIILLYHIQTKIILLSLLFTYSNQTKIILLKVISLKSFLLKYLLPKVKPNTPELVHWIMLYYIDDEAYKILEKLDNNR